jgi:hypothetical protein
MQIHRPSGNPRLTVICNVDIYCSDRKM